MPDHLDDLTRLRAEIDRIDDTMVDLLVERMGHVQAIARAKGVGDGRLAIRPAREATILRRLNRRADHGLSVEVVVRIWREIISAATSRQTPFSVAVSAAPGRSVVMELARGHFGTTTPLQRIDTSAAALRKLASGLAQIAVLDLFDLEEPWWVGLPQPSLAQCRVFGCLPFVEPGQWDRVWLFGPVMPEPSGDDLSLIRLTVPSDAAAPMLLAELREAGLHARHLAVAHRSDAGDWLYLFEIDGFFAGDDQASADLLIPLRHEQLQCTVLGAYPRGLVALAR